MLLGLFRSVGECVSDSPKVVHFGRIRYGLSIESEKSMQLRFPGLYYIYRSSMIQVTITDLTEKNPWLFSFYLSLSG